MRDLDEALKAKQARLTTLQTKSLVDLFAEAKVTRLDLEPEGNLPGYTAEARAYYKANIAADWEPERQAAAFRWLVDNGHADLIKTEVVITLGRKDHKRLKQLELMLQSRGFSYNPPRLTVQWNTLTAWLREQVEKYQRTPPLDVLGATVGRVVNLKEKS